MHARRFMAVAGFAGASMLAGGCTLDARDAAESVADSDGTMSSPIIPDSGTDATMTACAVNSDCPASQVCRQERCGPECREDFDCCEDPTVPCGRVCREEACVDGVPETCDGADNDADGEIDNGFDLANDVTNCGACGIRCDDVLAHVRSGGPTCDDGICRLTDDACADGFSDINGADADGCEYACFPTNDGVEEPDGDDNNCDGATDEGFDCSPGEEQVCGAGTGICQEGVQQCAMDGTWGECGDAIGPMPETCNGLDDDCNGIADDGLLLTDEVCDVERTDEDCDGEANEGCTCADDDDRPCGVDPIFHGVGVCHFGAQVCVSGEWTECVGAIAPTAEVCNGLDDDCDGIVPIEEKDADDDGTTPCGGDCNDGDPFVNPSASEFCDGVDQDCDGDTDEDFSIGEFCTGRGVCVDVLGTWECADLFAIRCSVDAGGGTFAGSDEAPNGLDDDCDGDTDEGFSCIAGDLQPCDVDVSLHGIGICRVGVQACGADGFWSPCVGSIFPTPESCNGLDDDCDGTVASSELDGDGDGIAPCAGDCNDGDASVFPDAAESCNDTDDDCDGDTDEDYFVTVPCDGTGACGLGVYECASPTTYRCSTNPGGSDYPDPAPVEVCDTVDNDCDGTTDLDADSDVVDADAGNCGACGAVCAAPNATNACVAGICEIADCDVGYLLVGGSCLRCERWPATDEACDGAFVDDDCDGLRNERCACEDSDLEPCGLDLALHGIGECSVGLQACTDGALGACVGAIPPSTEVCNGLDDDCDGFVPTVELDGDGDSFARCAGDCDDGDASVLPGAEDICNLVDDDCDGAIDESYFVGAPCNRGASFGASCQAGVLECNLEFPAGSARCSTSPGGSMYPLPAPAEVCSNLVDDDCDGSVDEGCGGCEPTMERPCGVPTALNGIGICRVGIQTCDADRTWGSCIGAVGPMPESCNGLDDDCDGSVDDGFTLATDPVNCGACGSSCTTLANVAIATCTAGACGGFTCRPGFQNLDGAPGNGCEYGCFPTNGGVEQCDGIDNDCDGAVDDDPSCSPAPAAIRTVTFAVTLPEGFALDGTRVLCSTFASGLWTCGDYALALGADGRTLTTSGDAVTGPHVFNLCTAACDDPVLGTWVVVRNADGTLAQAAVPTVTFSSVPVLTSVVRNARGTGGNWFAEFAVP